MLLLYDKCAGQQAILECISHGQQRLGKASPFDEWSKLAIVVQRAPILEDMVWVMENMIHDQETSKIDTFSKAELSKKMDRSWCI